MSSAMIMQQRLRGLRVSPPVFFTSAVAILAVVLYGTLWTDHARRTFQGLQDVIVSYFGWLYIAAVAFFLLFAVWLFFSRYGQVKLGPDDSEPEYSYTSWFAMLFAAGMGIGLMFYGVAEPLLHYANPPAGSGGTAAAAREAMKLTFFHWGFHAWGIYIVVGLSLAYFSFRHGLPLTIRSAFYPILGERIYGPAGHLVDTLAVLGTMFGLATSLGLGAMQINAGLHYLFDVPVGLAPQLVLITVITLIATVSVVLGLDRGIRRLSELNLALAVALFLFVLAVGPTVFLLDALVQNIGTYLGGLVSTTFHMYAFQGTDWQAGWTLFYWGWWIAWSPFVGMFIARISRGRTIREFVGGVLLVPAAVSFAWLGVFGDTALYLEIFGGVALVEVVQDNLPVALFVMLQQLPWGALTSLLATVLVITFFVTSSDSASLVIDILTAGGDPDPPLPQRVFWAFTEGAVAAALLLAGGLAALQTAAISTGLPFVVVLLLMCYALVRGLRAERQVSGAMAPPRARAEAGWRARLRALYHEEHGRRAQMAGRTREDVQRFLQAVVRPALQAVAEELRRYGRQAVVQWRPDQASITVLYRQREEFFYAVRARTCRRPLFAVPQPARSAEDEAPYHHAQVCLRDRSLRQDVMGCDREQLIEHFMTEYGERLRWWEAAAGDGSIG